MHANDRHGVVGARPRVRALRRRTRKKISAVRLEMVANVTTIGMAAHAEKTIHCSHAPIEFCFLGTILRKALFTCRTRKGGGGEGRTRAGAQPRDQREKDTWARSCGAKVRAHLDQIGAQLEVVVQVTHDGCQGPLDASADAKRGTRADARRETQRRPAARSR